VLLIGFLTLLLIGKLIEIYGYNEGNIKSLEKHDVMNAFIKNNNKLVVWLFFPMIMIIEELIFRYYLLGFSINQLNLEEVPAIYFASLIFSIFHIHTWFSYKNKLILSVNLVYSFLLGLFNGYIFLSLGIFPCIIIHYVLVFYLYYRLNKRYFGTRNK